MVKRNWRRLTHSGRQGFLASCLIAAVSYCGHVGAQGEASPSPRFDIHDHGADKSRAVGRDAELAELGRRLFFDSRLSADSSISCSTCHQPDKAFTDGQRTAVGIGEKKGSRNTPSLVNVGQRHKLFWDGRREDLESLIRDPLFSSREHGLGSETQLKEKLESDPQYMAEFSRLFPGEESAILRNVTVCIGSYLRTLSSTPAPVDDYLFNGRSDALTPAQVRGLGLFRGRGHCETCHLIGSQSASFTDDDYHSLAIGLTAVGSDLSALVRRAAALSAEERYARIVSDPELARLGRFLVTLKPVDIGKFRTPSLRNVAITAPYMHDGSVETLSEAIEHEIYYRGISDGRPLIMTPDEKKDLREFLSALTSSDRGTHR